MTLTPAPSRAVVLADTINGTLEDRFLGAAKVRVRGALDVRQVVLDELAIDGLSGVGPVVISGCRFGTLRLTDVVIREGVIIEDCDIGSLEVRGGRTSTLSILRCGIRRSVLHECGSLVIDSSTVTELAAISDVQARLELARSAVGSLRVSADGPTQLSDVRVFGTTVRDRLDLVGLDGERLQLRDVAAARAQIRNTRFDSVRLRELSIERDLSVHALAGRGSVPALEVGGVVGSVSITIADERGAELLLRGATVRGDLTLGGRGTARVEESCAVEGVLRSSQGPDAIRVRLDPGANVRAVQPPVAPVRTPGQARDAARTLLGGAGLTELAILRDSLQDRPDEQDMAYFAVREAEQEEATGVRRATMWLRGQFFGWGVTFWHPLRTLLGAVLLTASVVFMLNPAESGGPLTRVVDALTASLGLWFNVGTGMPDGLDGPGWALAAVACTALGIAIITVLTGVAIRRLTR